VSARAGLTRGAALLLADLRRLEIATIRELASADRTEASLWRSLRELERSGFVIVGSRRRRVQLTEAGRRS